MPEKFNANPADPFGLVAKRAASEQKPQKPHLMYDLGIWWCAPARNREFDHFGSTPKEAFDSLTAVE